MKPLVICWHRRDLRTHDNSALFHALTNGSFEVLPIFIFDTDILDQLEEKADARVQFIQNQLVELQKEYCLHASSLLVAQGTPKDVFNHLTDRLNIKAVYANNDYEPYARRRDAEVEALLASKSIVFKGFKDHVIFEKDQVIKEDRQPYTVFTPYAKKWKQMYSANTPTIFNSTGRLSGLVKTPPLRLPDLSELGFLPSAADYPPSIPDLDLIANYHLNRDFPGLAATTRLGLHLRFGTISIRETVQLANDLNQAWLNELIWRDFFQAILWHFPHTADKAFKPAYDNIHWENNEKHFKAWMQGQTGYPMVDAGMRELNATGFMHNRVRMVVASFLCKHLLIDWRWGETYFATKLLDYDQAANVGNWQWAAGSGCDAAPYFRVFNPLLQAQRFDPQQTYIRQWVPEVQTYQYVKPVIDHNFARERVLRAYKGALGG